MSSIQTINPSTGQLIANYDCLSGEQIDQQLRLCEKARQHWLCKPLNERIQPMQKLAKLLKTNAAEYAKLVTTEMGKPITQAIAEVEKCSWLCEHYCEAIEEYLAPQLIKTDKQKSYVCYQPLGIVFAIMPWNFPFWQVLRFAVPNLLAGNGGVLKHAPISTGTALLIEQLFIEAGFPDHLFKTLLIDVDQASQVIHHPLVHGVTLTGSANAGQAVGREAGDAVKKVVLELGGSDPYIILNDADLGLAAEQCAISRFSNTGQICISAKRIILQDSIRDEFLSHFLPLAEKYQAGDPMLTETTLGPMARQDLRDTIAQQVQTAIEQGAHCLLGGEPIDHPGFYYPATVLDHITADNIANQQELFGPVACLFTVENEQQAIALANDSEYGLGAAVFTQDIERGERIARDELQAGSCNVNCMVGSDPRLPFGGIKHSGYGRELSAIGAHEFCNIKTVIIN